MADSIYSRDHIRGLAQTENVYSDLEPRETGKFAYKSGWETVELYYELYGNGPTLIVCIGGMGSTHKSWRYQTAELGMKNADKYTFVVCDARGVGKSSRPWLGFMPDSQAADIIGLVDHIQAKRFASAEAPPKLTRDINVVAMSFGGMTAWKLASQVPERINSIVVTSSTGEVNNTDGCLTAGLLRVWESLHGKSFVEKAMDELRCNYTDGWLDRSDSFGSDENNRFVNGRQRVIAQRVYNSTHRAPDEVKASNMPMLVSLFYSLTDAEVETILTKVGIARITILHGGEDKLIPFPMAIELALRFRAVELIDPNGSLRDASDENTYTIQTYHGTAGWAGRKNSNWKVLPMTTCASDKLNGQPAKLNFFPEQNHMIHVEERRFFNRAVERAIQDGYVESMAEGVSLPAAIVRIHSL